MTDTWRGYMLIEGIATDAAKTKTHTATLTLGQQVASNPSRITHGRASLDGTKQIVEGVFRLAELEGARRTVADKASLSKDQEDALTMTPLGGLTVEGKSDGLESAKGETATRPTTWEDSHKAALVYLAANRHEWETSEASDAMTRER